MYELLRMVECLRYMRAEGVMNAACGTDGLATVSASGSSGGAAFPGPSSP